jgi:3-dehydroquinate synthetase
MYYELYIAEREGVCEREYAETFRQLILRVIKHVPAYDDIEKAARYAKYDKKNDESSTISLVVPEAFGESREIKLPIEKYVTYIKDCCDSLKK